MTTINGANMRTDSLMEINVSEGRVTVMVPPGPLADRVRRLHALTTPIQPGRKMKRATFSWPSDRFPFETIMEISRVVAGEKFRSEDAARNSVSGGFELFSVSSSSALTDEVLEQRALDREKAKKKRYEATRAERRLKRQQQVFKRASERAAAKHEDRLNELL